MQRVRRVRTNEYVDVVSIRLENGVFTVRCRDASGREASGSGTDQGYAITDAAGRLFELSKEPRRGKEVYVIEGEALELEDTAPTFPEEYHVPAPPTETEPSRKAIRILIEYDDGSTQEAHDDQATDVMNWWNKCEALTIAHGHKYRGKPLDNKESASARKS